MLTVLLQSIALASVGLFSPGSITIVILLLMSDRGWRNGLGYALGYISMYTLIGIAAISFGVGAAPDSSEPSASGSVGVMVLGTLLLALALRSWRRPAAPNSSRFSTILNRITPFRAFGFGAAIAVINVKNLAIFLSALSILLVSELPVPTKLLILIPVLFTFCLSVIVPVAIYLALPAQANHYLENIRVTIERYSRPIGIWLPTIVGCLLILRGLRGLL